LVQGIPYRFEDAVALAKKFPIPDAKYAVTVVGEPPIPDLVTNTVCVLRSVEFHNQPCLETSEVRDVRADRGLSTELEFRESSVAKDAPKTVFMFGLVAAQSPGKFLQPLRTLYLSVSWNRPLTRPAGTLSRKGRGEAGVS
jgi:hypothetical protein